MKKIFFLLGILLAGQLAIAQLKVPDLDKSPLDVTYYPANFPTSKIKSNGNNEPTARILYSRPQKKGRNIFGEEVKYNEVWRLGANEATELELFKPATFAGKRIPKGRYTVYCIPTEKSWTIIFNKDNYTWGSYGYKPEKDVARIEVPVQKTTESTEALSMFFDNNNWNILWDNIKVEVPVVF